MKDTAGFPHGILERIRGLHRDATAVREMGGASTITDDLAVPREPECVSNARYSSGSRPNAAPAPSPGR